MALLADEVYPVAARRDGGLFRASPLDGWLVGAALALGALLGAAVVAGRGLLGSGTLALLAAGVATGVWWGSNTVSHLHLHLPLFHSRRLSRAFSLYLTVLLGVPQTLWRERHLAHHAGGARATELPAERVALEVGLVALTWLGLLLVSPRFFLLAWVPGYLLGLGLCQLQGQQEHAGGRVAGVSFYGRLYNRLWFNDGYHVEHHRQPAAHWSRLPSLRRPESEARPSALPPVLRLLEGDGGAAVAALLHGLEELALRSPALQRYMVATHERALRELLPAIAAGLDGRPVRRVTIVGGGLFPRTALVARRVFPEAQLRLVDQRDAHLDRARTYLERHGHPFTGLAFEARAWRPDDPADAEADLLILPLALQGDRALAYRPRRPVTLVHDWLWRRRGRASAVVALPLLKRLNLA